jgi:hypothetical protein
MMSKVSLLLILLVVLVIFGPIVAIWSLNTLFPVLAIPYTLETWLATAVIAQIFVVMVFLLKENENE